MPCGLHQQLIDRLTDNSVRQPDPHRRPRAARPATFV